MGLLVHTLAGHSRALVRETGSEAGNRSSADFASLVDDLSEDRPRSRDQSGGTNRGVRGGDNTGSIEPHRLTDAQRALLAGDGTGGTGNPEPHLIGDPDLPASDSEPGARAGDHAGNNAAGGANAGSKGGAAGGSTGASQGANTGSVGDIEPYIDLGAADGVEPNSDPRLSSQDAAAVEERAITAMRGASMRFESLSALLRLTQAI